MIENEESVQEETKSEEGFKSLYDTIVTGTVLLNSYSDYCGITHSTVWQSVGADDVAKYIGYIRAYGTDSIIGDGLTAKAYDISPYNASDLNDVKDYIKQYQESLNAIPLLREDLETQYKELNELYGNDYDISDLKNFLLNKNSETQMV